MDASNYFPFDVDPNLISVYIGRVISLDPDFGSNGILYVDIFDPDDTDLDKGSRHSNQATASYAVRSCYNAWENPPEIKSKTQFDGAMNFTSSGDFHLRNYCFDMVTQTWFMTVSTLLNMFGIVNVPPVMVSLDTTPFPGQAVSVNVSVAAKEVVNESIESCLRDLKSDITPSTPNICSLDDVKNSINSSRTRSLRSSSDTSKDPVVKIIKSIVNPIVGILDVSVKPFIEFIECTDILLQIYSKNLDNIENILFPITQFAQIKDDGFVKNPEPLSALAVKDSLREKINEFKNKVESSIDEIKNTILDKVIEVVYNPIANLYMMVDSKIQDVITPIKKKVVELIGNYVKDPLSQLTGLISMAVQPVVSSLPTIVQLVVKLALKKLLQVLLGLPIKTILNTIIDAIESLLNSAVEKLETMVGEVISTAINTLIIPLISKIQKTLMAQTPLFQVDKLKEKLLKILNNEESFPKIYIGEDAVKPYKEFIEIDWSKPNELKAMLLALLVGLPSQLLDGGVNIQKYTENLNIFTDYNVLDKIQGCSLKNLLDEDIFIDVMNKSGEIVKETISPNGDLKEGTLYDKNGNLTNNELSYKKFSSKEEFLPVFESMHHPIMEEAVLGTSGTLFEKSVPQPWITNNVAYIDVPDGDKTTRYISYYNKDGNVIGKDTIEYEKGKYITLESNKVYYSTTIPHLQVNENDPPVGEDLVPVVEEINGSIQAKVLEIPKTVKASENSQTRKTGDILYNDPTPNEGESSEKTFTELSQKYYQPKVPETITVNSMSNNIKSVLNNSVDLQNVVSIKTAFKDTDFYKCITKSGDPEDGFELKICEIIKDGDEEEKRERDNVSVQDTGSNITITLDSINNNIIIKVEKTHSPYPIIGSDIRVIITCSVSNDKVTSCAFTELKMPIEASDLPPIPGTNPSKWPTDNNIIITGTHNVPDSTSTDYYTWMVSSVSPDETATELKDVVDEESSNNQLVDILTNVVQAIGQDEGFNVDALFNVTTSKALSSFGEITDAVSSVDSLISSTLERVDELQKVTTFIDKIAEVGDKVKDIADTAGPALEATAKAASAVAIQSCSMSQSATGKDFSFNSGDNYDLSTTSEARSQLPWCKELNREQFLEPNCKVLIMAVGAGKNNLYVIDILT